MQILCENCAPELKNKHILKKKLPMTLPVSYVAGVKLELVIISQQSLLHMTEIQTETVDKYEPHAPLEGRS